MGFISQAKTDQFHADDGSDGGYQDALIVNAWIGQIRNRLQIGWTDLFSGEQQMYAAPRFGSLGVNQHVHTRDMTVHQADRANRVRNAWKVRAVYGQINVFRQARRKRITRLNMRKDSQSTDDAVIDAGLSERVAYACCRCGQLIQVFVVGMQ